MFCSIFFLFHSNEDAEDFLNVDDGDLESTSLLNEDELLLSDNEDGTIYILTPE